MQCIKTNLYELAKNFRCALLTCPRDKFSRFQRKCLLSFPKQACDVASLLLAYYLRDRGFQDIERVLGCLDSESHVWLEVDGWIVDITADQFPGVDDPVIVVEATRKSWHSNFIEQSRGRAYPLEKVRTAYEQAYTEIKNRIELR